MPHRPKMTGSKMVGLKVLGAAALAAAAFATGATGTAHAQPTSLYAPSALVLTIGYGDTGQAVGGVVRAVTLSCAPQPQGTHPAARAACDELGAVQGDIGLLTTAGDGGDCTQVWDPVTVTADGVWQGRRIAWQSTYGNSCRLNAALSDSVVFNF
ncbi:subtilase-type protease inhibitor [Streptomyces sp. NPDC051320]|uniref:subtilase-type protease inhibitor n=1 Tax=Streptomyces sp. NPDC051320 TaxID=3154644 RepID=UPI003421C1EF